MLLVVSLLFSWEDNETKYSMIYQKAKGHKLFFWLSFFANCHILDWSRALFIPYFRKKMSRESLKGKTTPTPSRSRSRSNLSDSDSDSDSGQNYRLRLTQTPPHGWKGCSSRGMNKRLSVAVALLISLVLSPLLCNFLLVESAFATPLPFIEFASSVVAN